MLTGLPPLRHGLLRNGEQMVKGIPTVGGLFRRAGFESAAFLSVSFLKAVARGFGTVVARNQTATEIADGAIEWMQNEREGDRFLLWLHFYIGSLAKPCNQDLQQLRRCVIAVTRLRRYAPQAGTSERERWKWREKDGERENERDRERERY